ncbi:MAG: hypothetical protein K2N29_00840, partial [Ruminiclostridium sp.]|nr:hypothetical protein [Ruminiclostridium sp.]
MAQLKSLLEGVAFAEEVGAGEVLSIVHKNEENSLIIQLGLPKRIPYAMLAEASAAVRHTLDADRAE